MQDSFDKEFKMSDDKSIDLFEQQNDRSTKSIHCTSTGSVVGKEMFKSASSNFLDDEDFSEADFDKKQADGKAEPGVSDEQSMEGSRSNSFLNLIARIFRTSKSYRTPRRQSENDEKRPSGGIGCHDRGKSDGAKHQRSASADELDQRDRKGSSLKWLNKGRCCKAASVTLGRDQRPISESSLTTGEANSQPMAKLTKGGRQHLESAEER